MITAAQLSAALAGVIDDAGTVDDSNPNVMGRWKELALAAEAIAGVSTTANDNVTGYMLRTAIAFESVAGTSGAEENTGRAGYLKRIVDALEALGVVTEGSLGGRFALASPAAVFAYDPAELFASGEQGAWYDPSDLTSMWQDSAGTIPAAVNSPVGKLDDKSGRGNHLIHATTANKPILRQSGAVYYLEFDGVDDHLVKTAVSFNLYDAGAFTIMSAHRGGPPATDRYLLSHANSGATAQLLGPLRSGPTTATSNVPAGRADSNTQITALPLTGETQAIANAHPASDTVVTVTDDGSNYNQYVDGGGQVTTAYSRTGLTFTLNQLALGALVRTSAASYYGGRFHGLLIRSGAVLDAPTRANVRTYLGGKQGRTL